MKSRIKGHLIWHFSERAQSVLTNNGDKIKATPTPTKILYALDYKVITKNQTGWLGAALNVFAHLAKNRPERAVSIPTSAKITFATKFARSPTLLYMFHVDLMCVFYTIVNHTLNSLVQDTVGSFTCSCVPGYVYLLHHHYTECAFHWLSSSSGIAWKSRPHAQQSTFHQRCQWEFFHFIAFSITTIIIIGEEIMPKS